MHSSSLTSKASKASKASASNTNAVRTLILLLSSSSLLITKTAAFTPNLPVSTALTTKAFSSTAGVERLTSLCAQEQKQSETNNAEKDDIENENIIAKTSWYAAEALGKIFGSSTNDNNTGNASASTSASGKKEVVVDLTKRPSSMEETLQRIQLDNDRFYFLSGQVDALSYDPDCYFADPFVGFRGTDRFVENLQNLGSFITNYDVKLLDYDTDGANTNTDGQDKDQNQNYVKTRLMVKLELNLPWKPILAWPWGVKYEIDNETFLIVSHIESWDIEALEGVKQVFRKPTLKLRN
jgi:hypothetical protein